MDRAFKDKAGISFVNYIANIVKVKGELRNRSFSSIRIADAQLCHCFLITMAEKLK